MRISKEDRHPPKSTLPHNVELSVRALMGLFLSDIVIRTIRRHTNAYGKAKADSSRAMGDSDFFFAIVYYMGVISLPAKSDYWNTRGLWPKHKPCPHMSFSRFKAIWENIHLSPVDQENAYQFIANYCHSLRCRRIWMPIMFHALDLIRVNAYITYNSLVEEEEGLEQKGFVVAMVDKLLERSTTLSYSSTRSVHEKTPEINEQDPIRKRRRRVNHKHPLLPPNRVEWPTADHFMTLYLKRCTCKYCSYEIICFRTNGSTGTPPGYTMPTGCVLSVMFTSVQLTFSLTSFPGRR